MAFDVDGARKAGYSDDEIAGYLGQQKKFDVEGARKAGYSSQEIIGQLTQPQEPQQDVGIMATAARTAGQAAEGAVKMSGMAASTLARAADATAGIFGAKTHFEDDTFSDMEALLKPMQEMYDFKPNEKPSTVGRVAGAVASVPASILSWPQHSIDVASEMVARGATTWETVKAAGPQAVLDAAMNGIPLGAGARVATALGGGRVASTLAGAATGAGINLGIGTAERAVQNATLPDRPQFEDLKAPTQRVMGMDVPLPTDQEGLVDLATGMIFGAHGAHGEHVQERLRQIQADPNLSQQEKVFRAAEVIQGAKKAEVAPEGRKEAPEGATTVEKLRAVAPEPTGIGIEPGAPTAPAKPAAPEGSSPEQEPPSSTPTSGAAPEGQVKKTSRELVQEARDRTSLELQGLGPEHGTDLLEVREALHKDPEAVRAAAEQHPEHGPQFMAEVRRINEPDTAADRQREPGAGGAGDESRPGGQAQEPAVRRAAEEAQPVEAGQYALRNEQGGGATDRGQHPEAGPEVQRAGPVGGNAAGANEGRHLGIPLESFIPDHIMGPVKEALAQPKPEAEPVGTLAQAEGERRVAPMMKSAEKNLPDYTARLRAAAESIDGTPVIAPLKSMGRTVQKLWHEYHGEASDLKDLLRGSVIVDSQADVPRAIAAIKQHFGAENIVGGDERIAKKNRFENPTEAGYRDVLINVKMPDGHIAEVQIHTPETFASKDTGHHLYELSRVMKDNDPRKAGLEDLQRKLYGAARDAEEARAATSRENSSSETLSPNEKTLAEGKGLATPEEKPQQEPSGNRATGAPSTSKKTEPAGTPLRTSSAFIAPPSKPIVPVEPATGKRTSPEKSRAKVDQILAPVEERQRVGQHEDSIDRALGEGTAQKLQDNGVLRIIPSSQSALKGDLHPGAQAMFVAAKGGEPAHVEIYSDRADPRDAPALIMHEVGEHYGLSRMLGQDKYEQLLRDLKDRAQKDPEIQRVWNAIKQHYVHPEGHDRAGEPLLKEGGLAFMREVAAHLVETGYDRGPIGKMIDGARAFLYDKFGIGKVDAGVLRGLTRAALRSAANGSFRDAEPLGNAARIGPYPGQDDEIGTRLPTSVPKTQKTNPLTEINTSGLKEAKLDPKSFEKNVNLMSNYDIMPAHDMSKSVADRAEEMINHMKDNLLWLHDQMSDKLRGRAKKWYDGARKVADGWAKQYGIEPRAAAGVTAVLSPQKDWFQNVSMAHRVIDFWKNNQDATWRPEMDAHIDKLNAASESAQKMIDRRKGQPLDQAALQKRLDVIQYRFKDAQGKKFSEMDPMTQAFFLRAHDETFSDRRHPVISPEGDAGDWSRKKNGEPKQTAWSTYDVIAKGLSILNEPTRENISAQLGDEHKVRNFYNNIVAPKSMNGHVTIDTHAVAGALLKPLSGSDLEVTHNFGGAGTGRSSNHGMNGTYNLYAEAYKRAAAERGILPREMQSITWEAVRGLFKPEQKSNEALNKAVDAAWSDYRNGSATIDQVRQRIHDAAGGIEPPEWARPSAAGNEQARPAADRGELPGNRGAGRGLERPGTAGEGATEPEELMANAASIKPVFRSDLEQQLENAKQKSAPAHQWEAIVRGMPGIKKAEIEASGLPEYLKLHGDKKLTREEVAQYVRENGTQVNDSWRGAGYGKSVTYDKYKSYGGERYRELLLHAPANNGNEGLPKGWKLVNESELARAAGYPVPEGENNQWTFSGPGHSSRVYKSREDALNAALSAAHLESPNSGIFKSDHWDQPNVIAHLRMQDRVDEEGKKVLHLEELQSDWGQQGRKDGFVGPDNERRLDELDQHMDWLQRQIKMLKGQNRESRESEERYRGTDAQHAARVAERLRNETQIGKYLAEYNKASDEMKSRVDAVPHGPFVDDTKAWTALALKRAIRIAAEEGHDRISWANGDQNARRYSLDKEVDSIDYAKTNSGTYSANVKLKNGDSKHIDGMTERDLENHLGKEVAQKIIANQGREPGVPEGAGMLKNIDLKVGGEGMRAYYDGIVPQVANEVLRKLGGGKVKDIPLGIGRMPDREPHRNQGFDITPEMREKALGGQSLYSIKTGKPEPELAERKPFFRRMLDSQFANKVKDFSEGIVKDYLSKVSPMVGGSERAQKVAKDFANHMREASWNYQRFHEILTNDFTPEQLKRMWEAGDEENDMRRTGAAEDPTKGLASLPKDQQDVMNFLTAHGEALMARAKAAGMYEGSGVDYWVPRVAALIGEDGEIGHLKEVGNGGGKGGLTTKSDNLTGRKHLTTAEAEEALKAKFGTGAGFIKDIRTMPIAMARLERAIAGRELVNRIEEMSQDLAMDPREFVSFDHPALKSYRADEGDDGKINWTVKQRMIPKEFEGPLKAVLTQPSGAIYKGLLAVKNGATTAIMWSPFIHLGVEVGRAFPVMGLKMLPGTGFWKSGRALLQNPEQMQKFLQAGYVPIGRQGMYEDITSMAREPDLEAGRGLLAKGVGGAVGLVNKGAGEAIKGGIDKAGDFVHGTLLWDRVAELQAGIANEIYNRMIKDGHDDRAATLVAAHIANRYAGALPPESISAMGRKVANVMMFSRSFTLGNLGAMKDAFTGLPRDIKAQLNQELGEQQAGKAIDFAKHKARAGVAVDIALMYGLNALLQAGIGAIRDNKDQDRAWYDTHGLGDQWEKYTNLLHESTQQVFDHPIHTVMNPLNWPDTIKSFLPQGENEEGKRDRFLMGHDADGTAIYGRTPFGKIGEEMEGWLTHPGKMLSNKMSTLAKPIMESMPWANQDSFGRRIYRPDDDTATAGAKIAKHFIQAQLPTRELEALYHILTGKGKTLDAATIAGPMIPPPLTVTTSKGYPGGEAMGAMHAEQTSHQQDVQEARPDIIAAIKDGDTEKAEKLMDENNIYGSERRMMYRAANTVGLSKSQQKKFWKSATEADKAHLQNVEERARF